MSTEDPLKNWQLEGQGESPQQWKLQDAEQDLNKHMQLQPGDVEPQWQPVEYQREEKTSRRNWVLPSIVIVALLAVLGYVGWIFLGQAGGGSPGSLDLAALMSNISGALPMAAPTEAPAVVASTATTATATALPATPVVEPTIPPAVVPPTVEAPAVPTVEPTPTVAMVELITGTVNVVTGVNARSTPTTTADVVTLLNQNEQLTVVAEENGWLQVILPDGTTTAWVSSEFVDRVAQQVPLEVANAIRANAGLPLLPGLPAAPAAEPGPASPPPSLVVTVIGEPSINARSLPDVASTVVRALEMSTTLTAIGRTADDAWIAVQMPEGDTAWVVTNFVSVAGDVKDLDVLDPATLVPQITATTTDTLTTTTVPVTATQPLPTAPLLVINGVVPPLPFTNTLPALGPALAVSDTTGVNARVGPGTDAAPILVVPNGAVLSVVGRSATGEWLQVSLPDGQLGWMFAQAVVASADAANAPVTDGAATTAPEVAATAVVSPAGPTATATVSNQLGANLRTAPTRDLDPIVAASAGETFTAIGRTSDAEWVQLALADGTTAWALASTVELDADINTLAVTQP